jgi:hypothetical protein
MLVGAVVVPVAEEEDAEALTDCWDMLDVGCMMMMCGHWSLTGSCCRFVYFPLSRVSRVHHHYDTGIPGYMGEDGPL